MFHFAHVTVFSTLLICRHFVWSMIDGGLKGHRILILLDACAELKIINFFFDIFESC